VASLVAVKSARTTAEPVESVTVPKMVELADWAANTRGIANNSRSNLDIDILSLACLYLQIRPRARATTLQGKLFSPAPCLSRSTTETLSDNRRPARRGQG
jgi:hypothetical protein